jgi:3-deoxy-D-manno-octulosonic-acid transferase
MIYFYRILYVVLRVLIFLTYPFLSKKSKKLVSLRSSVDELNAASTRQGVSLWFHASSGEIEYAKPIIFELKKQHPEFKITVTYSSESAEKLFENLRPFVDEFVPLCWDQPRALKKLFQHIRPNMLIISRTDLWPEMLTQAQNLNVPVGVISYFPKISGLSAFFLKRLLSKTNFISCVDTQTAQKIDNLIKTSNVSVTGDGDTRFDQVFKRLESESKLNIITAKKLFICGSTWAEDDKELFAFFPEVLKNNYQVVLSPHEVSDSSVKAICEKLDFLNFNYQLLSTCDLHQIVLKSDFLIIDRIGFLADAYRFGDLAFVGGSFKARVHSVMEPLCCGLPVLVGPFFKNNPEALKYSQAFENQCVYPCQNTAELVQTFLKLNKIDSKKDILAEMKKNQGASKKIAQIILDKILKTTNS